MSDLIYAPQHERNISELGQAYIIEGVAYDPLKMSFLCNYDDDVRVFCKSCEWETTVKELPEDSGRVQPDMCPECAKNDELGFVRSRPESKIRRSPDETLENNTSAENAFEL